MEINEYWKLADQLSVHEASCLIIGVDRENTDEVFIWGDDYSRLDGNFAKSPSGYMATKQAILAGLRSKVIDGMRQKEQQKLSEIQSRIEKEDAWKQYYKKSPQCEAMEDVVACGNEYIASKNKFELYWEKNRPH